MDFRPKEEQIPELLNFLKTASLPNFFLRFYIDPMKKFQLKEDLFGGILSSIAQNTSIKKFTTDIRGDTANFASSPAAINPFHYLEASSIENLCVGSHWLSFLDAPSPSGMAKSEHDKQLSWYFAPKSVKRLKVYNQNNGSTSRFGKFLLASLVGNCFLETLEIIGLSLNAHCTSEFRKLHEMTSLQTLRFRRNLLIHNNFENILLPPHLETLDLSENPLGQGDYSWTDHPLKTLLLRKCALSAFVKGLPKSIETLDVSENQNMVTSVWLQKLNSFERLATLKMTNVIVNSMKVFADFIMQNKTVKHLEMFEESTFRENDCIKIVEAIRNNSTLVFLDYRFAIHFLTLPVCDHIQEILDTNSRLNSGRLTKGRR